MCNNFFLSVQLFFFECATIFFECASIFFECASIFFWVCNKQSSINNASIAQLAEHLLRKEKVTSSILVGGWQFAWSSWLWRSPHTREVPSSSLGANTTKIFANKFLSSLNFFCEKKTNLSSSFFPPQLIYFERTKKKFTPQTATPHSPADRGFRVRIGLKRLWSWYKPVLWLTTSFMERCGIVAYKFFQNWLRVSAMVFNFYIWAQTHQISNGYGHCGRSTGKYSIFVQGNAQWSRKKKNNKCMNFFSWELSFFFFGELSFFFGNFLFFWSMVARNASQHPEVVQNRGHGPGARASPALDPWTWLKQYS